MHASFLARGSGLIVKAKMDITDRMHASFLDVGEGLWIDCESEDGDDGRRLLLSTMQTFGRGSDRCYGW